ncbi:MAG: hypothetical protein KGL39_37380 [Patescibacteria group bacterium]|nr:hypothetical protein [Patescibacteria group bacterium]
MSALQASVGAAAVMLEGVWNQPQLLVEKDSLLDGLISSSGKAIKVSDHTYRVTFQDSIPGVRAAVALDAAVNFPTPGSPSWQEGFMNPLSWAVPVGWTELAKLTTSSQMLAVAQVVDATMRGATEQLKLTRDESLCAGDGQGYWGTISAVTTGANGFYTMSASDFGARLFDKGNNIDIYNGTTYVNTSNVTAVQKQIGGTQIVYVDTAYGAAADVIRFGGLTSGSPVFVYGLPYWINNSPTGMTIGIDRTQAANNFILANGVAAASSSLTPPLFRLGFDQMVHALGVESVKAGKFKIHLAPGQQAQYEQSGLSLVNFFKEDGAVGTGFDLLTTGDMKVAGNIFVKNIHANISRVDFLNLDCWGKIRWGDAPFWFNDQGRTIFQQIGTNGQIQAVSSSFMIDTVQYFVSNPKAQSYISGLPEPAGY